ncbi:homoserine kinase [Varibaculum massiliense]|uniref:homoserine kinase n=1 Tax=Varibaculum massiliense TaxID=1852372 RepID=UPI00288A5936|nr:homoserine kinase [Varibaculum massiliense]
MRIVKDEVEVKVPATSANLGPGYDCMGLALSLHDRVRFRATVGKTQVYVRGQGKDQLPEDENHLVVRAIRLGLDAVGAFQVGVSLWQENQIPQSRGLGSSASAIVSGLAIARAIISEPQALDADTMLRIATYLEGHPDNLAPAIYGGITLAGIHRTSSEEAATTKELTSPFLEMGEEEEAAQDTESDQPVLSGDFPKTWAVKIENHYGLRPTVFIPDFELDTSQARALLPEQVPHADAAANVANGALLVRALEDHPELLMAATTDYLHQNYRRAAMPASLDLMYWLRAQQLPAVISGAGPCVLVLASVDDQVKSRAEKVGWKVRTLELDTRGVREL